MFEQSLTAVPQVQPLQRTGAGFWPRFGGQLIDLVVHYAISFVVGLVVGFLIGVFAALIGMPFSEVSARLQGPTPIIGYVLAIFGHIVYHTLCEGIHGATLGKLIFGLHVVKEDGSRASLLSAFVRSLAYLVDSLFFGLVAYASMNSSERKQRLGDKWGKTMVVKRSSFDPRQMPSGQMPSGWVFAGAFLLGAAADALILGMSLLIKFF